MKRYIAILTVLALLVSFTGCKKDDVTDVQESTAKETESSSIVKEENNEPETESAEPSAIEIFESAVAKIENATSYKQEISVKTEKNVGISVFNEEYEISAQFIDTDKDTFTASVTEKQTIGQLAANTRETYYNGTVYLEYTDSTESVFSAPSTKEEFISAHVPLIPITASLYESVKLSEDDKNTIIFELPASVEQWLAPDYASVNDATASVTLSKEGDIIEFCYDVDYVQGNTLLASEISISLSFPEKYDDIAVPEAESCISFDYIQIPMLITTAFTYLENQPACIALVDESALSYVFGESVIMREKNYSYGTGDDYTAKIEKSLTKNAYKKDPVESTSTTTYKDGKISTSMNASEPSVLESTPDSVKLYISNSTTNHLIVPNYIETATVADTGSFYVIEYTGTELLGDFYEQYTNTLLFGSEDFTRKYITDYSIDNISGFISIDKDSLMPTAISIDYQCSYNAEGNTYPMMLTSTLALNIGDITAYEKATGESLPEAEPEQPATPLFYEVTSPDGDKMYLLGTIHIGDERTAYLPVEIYSALEHSDILAVEVDNLAFDEALSNDANLNKLLYGSYYYTDGTATSDHIAPEVYDAAIIALKGAGYTNIRDELLPTTIQSIIEDHYTSSYHGLSPDKGVDYRLLEIARKSDKTIESVESFEDRLKINSLFSDEIQEMLLVSVLADSRNRQGEATFELFELWCEGDEKKLKEYLNDNTIPEEATEEEIAMLEEYNTIMLTNRDKVMLDAAINYLEGDETVFYAVGLAHLLSETGLVDGLRDAGYTVELVKYE